MRTPNPLPIITICIALLMSAALSLHFPISSSANPLQGSMAAPLGATTVGGIISSDTTWALAGSPYIVTSNVRVNSGVTLTIEPGVEVRFDAGKGIQIDGTLIAQGTNSQRVTFTANQSQPAAGAWQYINFTSTSVSATFDSNGNYVNGSILRYCNVLYGGGGVPGAVHIQNTSPFIDHCQIRDGEGAGVYAINPTNLRISNNTISNNTRVGNPYQTNGGGIYVNGGGALIRFNTISNNSAYEGAGGVNLVNISNPTFVSENIIMNNTADGNDAGVGGVRVVNNVVPVLISHNTISNNSGRSGYGGDAGGVKVVNNRAEVNIEDNTISLNNGSRGGGIDIGRHGFGPTGSATIRNNSVTENVPHGIYLYEGDFGETFDSTVIIGNIVSNNVADGINLAYGTFTVTHNLVTSNLGNGIVLGEPNFSLAHKGLIAHNSVIRNAGIALLIRSNGQGGVIRQNLALGNDGTTTVLASNYNWSFAYNNLHTDSSTYTLLYSGANGSTLSATNNWWGTATDSVIQSQIYDWSDDGSKGIVNYVPFLTSPDTSAPVSPPTGVTLTLGSNGSVTVSWSANPEADVVGYKLYYDTNPGYPYANVVDVGNVTSHTLSGLGATIHHIAVTAYDASADGTNDWTDGNESWFSNEVIADLTPPTVQFSQSVYSVNEGGSQATITATLSKQYGSTVTVAYSTANRTAIAPDDYATTSGTLTFAPGQTSQSFSVPIVDDQLDELDETISLTLSNPSNATLGTPASATLTIIDNDDPPTVQLSSATYTVGEDAGTLTISVTLSSVSGLPVFVNYSTSNGTATAGSDYTATSGTLTFAAGETSKTVAIPIIDDLVHEADETFTVTLSNPGNASLGTPASATVTIIDNDAPPSVQFSASSYTVDEGAATLLVTITLSAASEVPATVDYATGNGTATAGSDYTSTSGTLIFAAGETSKSLTIPIIDNLVHEADETFTVTLSNPTNASLGTPASAIVTISDNDAPPAIRFSHATYVIDESAGTALLTVILSTASGLPVEVAYSTANGTAVAPDDYTATNGTLTFAPGETSKTIAIAITDDSLDEIDESLSVALVHPTNATLGTPSTVTLTILDNDGPSVAFNATNYSVNEDAGSAVLEVTLSATSVQTVTVAYATHDGTALAGHDYLATSGVLSFAPGEQTKQITVPIIDDITLLEPDETFTVTLLDPTKATLGTPVTAIVTIVENDVNAPPIAVTGPPDPSQPVAVSVDTPAGTVQIILEELQSSGMITVVVSTTPPDLSPSNFTLLGINYQVTASGIEFGRATIRFPYRAEDVAAAGVPEESLRLLHFENGQWQDITTSLDAHANTITGVTESFSPFVIGVQNMQDCAISLNNGAHFTGQLNVQTFSNTPDATAMLLSNDAGFSGAQWQPYHTAQNWTLTDPGSRIVTLLVYARLRDANANLLCSGLNLSDDIIYDPLPPTITSATIQSIQSANAQTQAQNSVTLELIAVDQAEGSGVTHMQVSTDASFRGARWQPYNTTAQVAAQPQQTIYIRVRDGVGNLSAVATATGSDSQPRLYLPLVAR